MELIAPMLSGNNLSITPGETEGIKDSIGENKSALKGESRGVREGKAT